MFPCLCCDDLRRERAWGSLVTDVGFREWNDRCLVYRCNHLVYCSDSSVEFLNLCGEGSHLLTQEHAKPLTFLYKHNLIGWFFLGHSARTLQKCQTGYKRQIAPLFHMLANSSLMAFTRSIFAFNVGSSSHRASISRRARFAAFSCVSFVTVQ